jgi:hypothetical protein
MDRASRDTISSRIQLIHRKLMLFPHRILGLGDGDERVSREEIGVDGLVFARDSWIGRVMGRVGIRRGGTRGLKLVEMLGGEWGGGRS